VQYVFLWALGAPNSRAAPGSAHSSYATVHKPNFALIPGTTLKLLGQKKSKFSCSRVFLFIDILLKLQHILMCSC